MATNTPYLNLALLGLGESVGTWGIPLNANFQKVDVLAGEVIAARGSASNVNDRISSVENETTAARGTFGSLNDRLSVLLLPNGTLNVGNFPKATASAAGIARLSLTAVNVADPIVVGDNDARLLTSGQKVALTNGGTTSLHGHDLSSITDVTATASEVNALVAGSVTTLHKHNVASIADLTASAALINQAITGISANVTSDNLNTLTGGGTVPKALMTIPVAAFNYTGIVSLSATPADLTKPIAIGDNDTRILTQTDKNLLTSAGVTSLHKHTLANGASDVTMTVSQLNQLAGISANVTASNLNILTGGSDTTLHTHDVRYYTKTQSDAATTVTQAAATTAIATHNSDNSAHANANLSLGDIVVKSINSASSGVSQTIRSHASDANGAIKWEIKDKSGVSKIYGTESGELHVDKLVSRIHEVVETTTLSQEVIAATNLVVNGNTVLGNDIAVDTLAVNAVVQFNAPVAVTGGITASGTVSGSNITTITSDLASVKSEVTNARGASANLLDRLGVISGTVTTVSSGLATFIARNDNPNSVTITQAIAADGGTGITVAELETLSDGSSADGLHTHAKYDTELTAARNSAIYGAFGSLDLRLEASEAVINGVRTEVTNARDAYVSVDARLDAVDILIGSNNSSIAGRATVLESDVADLVSDISDLNTNKAGKYVFTGSSNTTHVVTHNLGNQYPSVTIWDTATNTVVLTGITSITGDSGNQTTVVLGSATAVKIIVQG